ncbi:hypothetical protein ANCDUO_18608 [Ancylostoma duodenale]|uniref:Uncharacterized protein n=1 Tax=Ancylostoma duodenale TaxID=51022 RepID=A0A0C2G2P2_9BILA|nr:hypothetical protein ANCDUO_18608 [Ancylostoma duodenale]
MHLIRCCSVLRNIPLIAMAELPDIGGRCDFESCNRLVRKLSYLPVPITALFMVAMAQNNTILAPPRRHHPGRYMLFYARSVVVWERKASR